LLAGKSHAFMVAEMRGPERTADIRVRCGCRGEAAGVVTGILPMSRCGHLARNYTGWKPVKTHGPEARDYAPARSQRSLETSGIPIDCRNVQSLKDFASLWYSYGAFKAVVRGVSSMRKFSDLAVCALVLSMLASGAAFAGTVTGTVTFEGDVPTMRPLDMGVDPICQMHHEDGETPVNETLVLGEGNTMANIYVKVSGGLPEDATYPVPEEPAVLTQQGCVYKPRVFVVRAGQTLKILNPDGTMHNVNAMPEKNRPFNRGMPASLHEIEQVFTEPEDMFPFQCDVHPWMRAYCAVIDHPYFDVTAEDGVFTISGLPAGEYEIEAWHERLGKQTATVTIEEGGEVTRDFVFSR